MTGDTDVNYPERFARDCAELELLAGVEKLMVACSGGADSTALALLLAGYLDSLGDGAPEFYLGHVNHALRGADSDADEVFTRELARRLGARFLSVRLQATVDERPAGSLSEGRARELRYEAYRNWSVEHRLDRVLTAHHRDDQQETLLLRLCRGTGVRGLAGIPASRLLGVEGHATRLARPLLNWSRDELLQYLDSRGQTYRTDQSNNSLEIPRNRLRHEVLPLLEEHVHPGVRSSLAHLAEQATELQGDLESLGARALAAARLTDPAAEGVFLSLAELLCWPRSVRREAYAAVARDLSAAADVFFTRQQFESVEGVLQCGDNLAAADLGGGLRVERAEDSILFSLESAVAPSSDASREDIPLQIDGQAVAWRGWSLSAHREPWSGPGDNSLEEWVAEDSIDGGLRVRGRLPGDRVWPLGAPGRKKLKEFLRERGVPVTGRDGVPLIVSGEEIVWVVGQRLCQPFSVPPGDAPVVKLRACRMDEAS